MFTRRLATTSSMHACILYWVLLLRHMIDLHMSCVSVRNGRRRRWCWFFIPLSIRSANTSCKSHSKLLKKIPKYKRRRVVRWEKGDRSIYNELGFSLSLYMNSPFFQTHTLMCVGKETAADDHRVCGMAGWMEKGLRPLHSYPSHPPFSTYSVCVWPSRPGGFHVIIRRAIGHMPLMRTRLHAYILYMMWWETLYPISFLKGWFTKVE